MCANFLSLFPNKKPIMAMLHMKGDRQMSALDRAKLELKQYLENGVDAVIVEDYFGSKKNCISMLEYLQKNCPDVIYGVNLLSSTPEEVFQVAQKYGAKFVQIDSVSGHLSPDSDTEFEESLKKARIPGIYLIGGVRFKYQPVCSGRSLEEDLRIGMKRCDAIAVTGSATGEITDIQKIRQFRSIIDDFPLVVAAGLTPDVIKEQLSVGDAGIVGSWLKVDHVDRGDVDPKNVREFMNVVSTVR